MSKETTIGNEKESVSASQLRKTPEEEEGFKDKSPNVQLALRNTVEVLGQPEMEDMLNNGKHPVVYIGRAVTGPLHVGHLIALSKVLDLQKAGFETTILLADVHAALDDLKSKWEDLERRVEYTKKAIELAVDWIKMPKIVIGSSFQTTKEYEMDIFKFSTMITVKDSLHAASEVTRMKNPKVSELIYPIMQALDEQYLGVDMQLGGQDQRHIMVMAREYLPLLNYKKRVEMMTPLLPSLLGPGVKMSSSIKGSNIKVNSTEADIKDVITKAYCPPRTLEDNPVLGIARMFILPNDGKLVIERPSKFGGDLEITSASALNQAYLNGLHPVDLKNAVTQKLIEKLAKVRAYFEDNHDIIRELGGAFE